jgi:DNA-binding NtrC family response regulator
MATVPHVKEGLPVRSVRVVITDGPDKGKSLTTKGEKVSLGTADNNALKLSDPTVSRYHLDLCAKGDGIEVTDLGSTNGTLFEKVRLGRAVVPPKSKLKLGKTVLKVEAGDEALQPLHTGSQLAGLLGGSQAMRRVMELVVQASRTDAPVLVYGESGTGKEVAARALHELSSRSKGPFVTVDCGALSTSLISSELFGHEKGAFTGADKLRQGAFERAAGGTLFLDEVGELSPELQPALLGVLERKQFRRLGGNEELRTDVRVVSATNRDLRTEVNTSRFRMDLFYRLAVVTVELPALRDRAEDIPTLVAHFLEEFGARESPLDMAALQRHRWPGNVRELRNTVESALVLGELPPLQAVKKGAASVPLSELEDEPYRVARAALLGNFERQYLGRLIQRAKGNVAQAARLAKMDRSHLIELLERNGMK